MVNNLAPRHMNSKQCPFVMSIGQQAAQATEQQRDAVATKLERWQQRRSA